MVLVKNRVIVISILCVWSKKVYGNFAEIADNFAEKDFNLAQTANNLATRTYNLAQKLKMRLLTSMGEHSYGAELAEECCKEIAGAVGRVK